MIPHFPKFLKSLQYVHPKGYGPLGGRTFVSLLNYRTLDAAQRNPDRATRIIQDCRAYYQGSLCLGGRPSAKLTEFYTFAAAELTTALWIDKPYN